MIRKLPYLIVLFMTIAAAAQLWPGRAGAVSIGNMAPDIAGASWINSKPLTINDLKGRVVLVDFWTYG
jgi:hypothetical protein